VGRSGGHFGAGLWVREEHDQKTKKKKYVNRFETNNGTPFNQKRVRKKRRESRPLGGRWQGETGGDGGRTLVRNGEKKKGLSPGK